MKNLFGHSSSASEISEDFATDFSKSKMRPVQGDLCFHYREKKDVCAFKVPETE